MRSPHVARLNDGRAGGTGVAGEEKEEKSTGAAGMQCLPQWLPPLSSFLLHSLLLNHKGLFFFFQMVVLHRKISFRRGLVAFRF